MLLNRRLTAPELPSVVAARDAGRAVWLAQMLASMRGEEIRLARALRERDALDGSTPGDYMDTAAEHDQIERSALMLQSTNSRLMALENALERAARGAYGICEACGGKIPRERLQVVPTTVFCVDCQAEREPTSGRPTGALFLAVSNTRAQVGRGSGGGARVTGPGKRGCRPITGKSNRTR